MITPKVISVGNFSGHLDCTVPPTLEFSISPFPTEVKITHFLPLGQLKATQMSQISLDQTHFKSVEVYPFAFGYLNVVFEFERLLE